MIWLNKQSQSLSVPAYPAGLSQKRDKMKICVYYNDVHPRGVKRERTLRKSEGKMNRRIAFLSSLLWGAFQRSALLLSVIPYSLRNLFAYAEIVILACTCQASKWKTVSIPSTRSQNSCWAGGWSVYLWSLCIQCKLLSPPNYRDHMFVSPYLRHLCVLLQWNAICPQVGLNCSFFPTQSSPIHRLHMSLWKEIGLSKLLFSNNYSICLFLCL